MSAERIIGIDFGTSTSFVKVKRYEDGKPAGGDRYETKAVVFDGNGSIAVPTVIQRAGEQYWFGYDADSTKPGGTVYRNFKVDLESSDAEKRELARSLTKQFFKYIYQKYDEQRQFFGDKTDTEKTLVSYPAKWSEETSKFMTEAAREAGFQNVTGVDEASAAINAVMVQKADELQEKGYLQADKPVTLMLIDMGAGTTDMAVCRYTAGSTPKNEIITTWPKADGDILFGGREVDEILCDFLSDKLTQNGIAESFVKSLKTLRIGEIKAWKEYTVSDTLSRGGKVEYCTVLDGLYMMMGIAPPPFTAIDRSFFESLAGDYLKKFAELINGCIEHTKSVAPDFKASDISLVVLTGGHSQWYFAEQILTGKLESLGEVDLPMLQNDDGRILRMARPQETVSMGLAYSELIPELKPERTEETEQMEGTVENQSYDCGLSGMIWDYNNWLYYIFSGELYKVKKDRSMQSKLGTRAYKIIAINDDWIYYYKRLHGTYDKIWRIRTDGTENIQLSDDTTYTAKVVDDYIYYIHHDHQRYPLIKMQKDGTRKESIQDNIGNFIIVDDWIYYQDYIFPYSHIVSLYKMRTDGTMNIQIIKKGTKGHIIVANDWIYYNDKDYKPCVMRTDGTMKQRLADESLFNQQIVGDWIYYKNGGQITKMRTDGTTKTCIKDIKAEDFVVTEEWIYYTDRDNKTLYKMKPDGNMKTLLLDDPLISTFSVANNWVYYKVYEVEPTIVDKFTGQKRYSSISIYRVSVNGGNKQKIC